MMLQKLGPAFVGVALLAGSFAAGLVFMGSPSGANREDASPRPALPEEDPASKAAGQAKAEQVPEQPDDPEPRPAPREAHPRPQPESKRRQLSLVEASALDRGIGRRVTWVGQPIHSQSEKGGTQHIFFGKGPDGEFSFDLVFIAEEPQPSEQSPGQRVLDGVRRRFLEKEHGRRRIEAERRRTEARERARQEFLKGGREGIRKHIEETRKRLEERRRPENRAEILAKVRGKGATPLPISVTVTGTISRFDALLLLGYGNRYGVPVLRNVTITANP